MARGTIVTRTLEDGSKRYNTVIRINGKQRWKTFERKKDAEGYLDRNSTDVREHTFREIIPATFQQYAERWRKKYLIPQELKPSTLSVYSYCLDKHLISTFGPAQVAAVTTADITDFRANLLKSGRSKAYVKKLMNLLHRFFGDAQEDGYIRISPMPQRRRKQDRQSKPNKEGRALQYAQAQMLLEQCEPDPEENREAKPELKLIIMLGLLAGLRRGEIFALDFSDIDWERDIIHIRRNLFWRYGKHHNLNEDESTFAIYTPKSDKSVRDVDLSPVLKDALWTRYMEMQMAGKTGLVFQSQNGTIRKKDGAYLVKIRGKAPKTFMTQQQAQQYLDENTTPLDPKNIYERWFKPAVDRAKKKAEKEDDKAAVRALGGLRLHDLRHTFGSWKIAQGEDVLYVSAQMGHARPSITFDIYSHLLEQRRPKAAAKTDALLFGETTKTVAGDS